jgi:hypothetical protein
MRSETDAGIYGQTDVQFRYLEVTVQKKLRSGWPGPFVKNEGCCDKSFVCFQHEQTSQVQLQKPENACTAFPSTLVSMLKLSPPLPVLLLLHVGGLSRLNTRALAVYLINSCLRCFALYADFLDTVTRGTFNVQHSCCIFPTLTLIQKDL